MSKEVEIVEEFVVDTSVIIEGELSKLVESGKVKNTIIIHKAVVAELEHQANYGREIGFLGLDELKKINELASNGKINISYTGNRPGESQIKRAKSGEIDAMIRDLAWDRKATLVTGDKVQGEMAKALGMKVILINVEKVFDKKVGLEKFFDETTMSVHLKEGVEPFAKKGKPGSFEFKALSSEKLTKEKVKALANELVLKANMFDDSFVEIERKFSKIIQYEDMRIVITSPPFSDGWEITAVRPLVKLEMDDYHMNSELLSRFAKKAEGVLIAGSPGAGKTTFARALANFYESQQKIVKTVESPRDLNLKSSITQYSKNFGSSSEIHDILLLSRPDYTIFDEVRDTRDFKLYTDLRLSGIGMVGVIHSTTAIDAVQRFIGRLELGMIPSVLDTVIFIDEGGVSQVLDLNMSVKVPTGMIEADLARPVVEIRDFINKNILYEIYSYGEETVVVPITKDANKASGLKKLAENQVRNRISRDLKKNQSIKVEATGNQSVRVYADKDAIPHIIGRDGKTVQDLEKELGVRIDVRDSGESVETPEKGDKISYSLNESKQYFVFEFGRKVKGHNLSFFSGDDFVFDGIVGKKGQIRVAKKSELGVRVKSLISQENFEVFD
ncbi:MAG: Flp pilus assembly complex ATPase component TadA [Nanoarchaeota archaeon]|nr:Flp pilus assembly complex ATPase component TadA [Nanoarchaeota archaeon]